MATLAGTTIADTYDSLLHVEDNTAGLVDTATDSRVIQDGVGANSALALATDSVRITSTNKLYFNDVGGEHISGNGSILSIAGGNEIDLTATAIDINGTVDMSSTLAVGGDVTISASASTKPHFTITNTHGDGSAPQFIMKKDSASPADDDEVGRIYMYGDDDAGNPFESILIRGITTDVSNGSEDSRLEFLTYKAGAQVSTLALDSGAVGIGTASPSYRLSAEGTDAASSEISVRRNSNDVNGSLLGLRKSRGTSVGSSTIVANNDYVGQISFYGQDGTNDIEAASIRGYVNGSPGTNDMPGALEFRTTADGASSSTSQMTIASTGKLTVSPNISGDYAMFVNQGNSAGWGMRVAGGADNDDYILKCDNGSGNHKFSVKSGGHVGIGASPGSAMLFIDQDVNTTAFKIDGENTTTNCLTVEADALTSGSAGYFYSNSPSDTARRLFQIQNDNHADADATVCLYILQDGNSDTIQVTASDASYTNNIQFLQASGRSSSDAFKFLECYTGGDTDVQHKLRGDGVTQNRSGTFEAADYAEYFESKDGKVIAIGSTVKLDGDKIVACEDGDNPLGVIRPLNTSLVGNSAWANWGSKYLTDDYGSPIMEEYSVTEWMEDTDEVKTEEVKAQDGVEAKDAVLYKEGDELPEGKKVGDEKEAAVKGKDAVEAKAAVYKHKDIQYQTDKIPSDVTVPSDASVTSKEKDGSKLMRKKLNPDYDESKTYVEREKRDEWHIVGLLGQIPITKGQPVSSSWTKMKDVSDKVEMWMIK